MTDLFKRRAGLASVLAASVLLTGCFGDDDDNDSKDKEYYTYEVTVLNATAGQPFSPLALIAHTNQYKAFTVGEAASTDLEYLAEGGSNSQILEGVADDNQVHTTLGGEGAVAPGASQTLTLKVEKQDAKSAYLTVLTMLVNTNDAVVAARGVNLSDLAVNGYHRMNAIAYDAGTEANTETAATIPGPAGGGEGFNATRDDRANLVTAHAGVVTSDDGLSTSALTHLHRWDNPTAVITVKRTR